ncbi:MAG: thermonuclease family protein [Alphaproteobacteria bacterium]|nr:thermonuclease family protein [Alphaproteobacteria bacterium]
MIDGNTLRYQGSIVHLWGIDAPEKGQRCADGWPAGEIAAQYLAGLVQGRKVACDLKSTAKPSAVFAACTVDGQDLGQSMAAAGMAWSYPAQSQDYTVAESNAMIQVMGVHAHPCMKAWEWRSRGLKTP